jgi:hypothetical protein
MRQRTVIKKQPAPVVTASANGLEFHEPRKVSTNVRIKQLVKELGIDQNVYKFQAALREYERRAKNNFFTL